MNLPLTEHINNGGSFLEVEVADSSVFVLQANVKVKTIKPSGIICPKLYPTRKNFTSLNRQPQTATAIPAKKQQSMVFCADDPSINLF